MLSIHLTFKYIHLVNTQIFTSSQFGSSQRSNPLMFYGQTITQNQALKIINQQNSSYQHLLLTHVALDANSDVSHLYLKFRNKEILLLQLNRAYPPIFATINIHIDLSDQPQFIAKSGTIHVSGYFIAQSQKIKKTSSFVLPQFSVNNKRVTKQVQKQQQKKVNTPSSLLQSRRSRISNFTKQKQLQKVQDEDEIFQTNKKTGLKSQKNDKKEVLNQKKQVKRSSLSMLLKQAEQQEQSDDDSDDNFDESQESDSQGDQDQQEDQDDETPPTNFKRQVDNRQVDKMVQAPTGIQIQEQPQAENQQMEKGLGQKQGKIKVRSGMGQVKIGVDKMKKVDFSQWQNLIKVPTKKPSFL